jgi:ABC-type uncharacterized transport system substrate-binding protein
MYIYSFAHPHTFIELYPTLLDKDKNNITLNIQWHFDEMTSSMFMMDFDTNGDFSFDEEEKKIVYQDGFSHLNEFNYYTYLLLNKKNINISIKDFDVLFKNNKVVYNFNIDIPKDTFNNKDFHLEFYDQDLYMAFILKDNFISNQTKRNLKISKIENSDYFGYTLK